MKLLTPPMEGTDYVLIRTFSSYARLWYYITFSLLLYRKLLCYPFRQGNEWVVALSAKDVKL